jgi:glycosyltransferase involved in cell wall biosynthesis
MTYTNSILLFEASSEGHIASHTDALVAAISAQKSLRAVFVLPKELLPKLASATISALNSQGNVSISLLSDEQKQACRTGNGFSQGRARFNLALDYARKHAAEHIFFYYIDSALFGSTLARTKDITFCGIFFKPKMHLAGKGSGVSIFSGFAQWCFLAIALRKKSLQKLWSLDPIFPEFAARWLPFGRKVRFLPEIKIPLPKANLARPNADRRTNFLLYGILKRRKGVMELLEALVDLPPASCARMRLVLAGAVADDLRDDLPRALDGLRQSCPDLEVVTHLRFLDEAELAQMIRDCDVVLAPYVGHVGSSGVVYNAAQAGKPVLATHEGLVGELTDRYELGLAVDPRSRNAFVDALTRLLNHDLRRKLMRGQGRAEYLSLNAPEFSNLIIESFLEAMK